MCLLPSWLYNAIYLKKWQLVVQMTESSFTIYQIQPTTSPMDFISFSIIQKWPFSAPQGPSPYSKLLLFYSSPHCSLTATKIELECIPIILYHAYKQSCWNTSNSTSLWIRMKVLKMTWNVWSGLPFFSLVSYMYPCSLCLLPLWPFLFSFGNLPSILLP